MEGALSRVATLGAYYDLEGVIQAVTTRGSTVDDRFVPWEGHPIAGEVLAARASRVAPGTRTGTIPRSSRRPIRPRATGPRRPSPVRPSHQRRPLAHNGPRRAAPDFSAHVDRGLLPIAGSRPDHRPGVGNALDRRPAGALRRAESNPGRNAPRQDFYCAVAPPRRLRSHFTVWMVAVAPRPVEHVALHHMDPRRLMSALFDRTEPDERSAVDPLIEP